jgi:hypothetical protein
MPISRHWLQSDGNKQDYLKMGLAAIWREREEHRKTQDDAG